MMTLLSVADARARILEGAAALPQEWVPLAAAHGRTLSADLIARRTQPPFAASAMDGYALRGADASDGAILTVIGEAPAGRAFSGRIGPGETVRIFTGAPVPDGADTVLIQENVDVLPDNRIRVTEAPAVGRNIRAEGLDFRQGETLLHAGHRLDWKDIALAAAMNYPDLPVSRAPRIGILATGDELVAPGSTPRADQIIASNSYGLAAFVASRGGVPVDLGIAPDDRADLIRRLTAATTGEIDVLVTLGGASVGDHDLVREALGAVGLDLAFWKIAMRPGKPLMFGRLADTRVIGLPGNPVSSLVGAILFLGPLIGALSGQAVDGQPSIETAILAADMKPNDSRADYIRATLTSHDDGLPRANPFDVQDSSMLRRFVSADCLIIRPLHAPAAAAGERVQIIRI
jgi:molybdopterin molybdotransferase